VPGKNILSKIFFKPFPIVAFPFVILAYFKNSIINKLNGMDEYVLIMRHEDGTKVASPEQIQEWMKQTMEWISGISARHKFVGGTGLPFAGARVVNSDKMVINGPFGDIKETIGGFITVKADSVEEAVEFAKGCPVLQGQGNTVEVRRVAKNDGVH
jgi:hypothetical protein